MTLIEHCRKNGITKEKLEILATHMDNDIREHVKMELGPCEPMAFLERYCELDPDFGEMTAW